EDRARAVKARPRFQPVMEIDNPRKGRLPTRPSMSRPSSIAFCYSAAANGQTAMEMQISMPGSMESPEPIVRQHGVLSWSFVRALVELNYECTHLDLYQEIRKQMLKVKEMGLPRMDQEVLLTIATPLSKPGVMRLCQPVQVPAHQLGRGNSLGQSMRLNPPVVVPPPPPGYVASQQSASASSGYGREAQEPMYPGARPPQRCASELIHHNVEGRDGGSFK
ncbi:unnamed protein product, partial [Polarella glacialis]